jgi:hypothetical protein
MAAHETVFGTSRKFAATQLFGRFRERSGHLLSRAGSDLRLLKLQIPTENRMNVHKNARLTPRDAGQGSPSFEVSKRTRQL